MEILPGLHRIEATLGDRYLYLYLLVGDRCLLVDAGVPGTPDEAVLPYLEQAGISPHAVDFLVVTHADVDHFGGAATLRRALPRALLCAHERDAAWIERHDRALAERYGWYDAHGLGYDPDTARWLRDAAGPDVRLDLYLQGGDVIWLGPDRPVRVLHLPGHSAGHIGLYDAGNGAAIIADAVLGRGLNTVEGARISPPPYFAVAPYLGAIDTLDDLSPEYLLTAHYPTKTGADVPAFLEESRAFVDACDGAVAETLRAARGALTLRDLTAEAERRLGPFPVMGNELAGPVLAHVTRWAERGRIIETARDGRRAWRWA